MVCSNITFIFATIAATTSTTKATIKVAKAIVYASNEAFNHLGLRA
jgi:hypothetical protein